MNPDPPHAPPGPPAEPPAARDEPAAAFARHVEPELGVLYRVALGLTGQPADAEDLVQDTLIRAYRGITRFDGAHPRAWLLTILRNTHRNRARTRTPDLLGQRELDAGVLEAGQAEPSTEQVVVDPMFEAVVAQALAGLPAIHRVVVGLVDIDGLSYGEAAAALQIPRGTVMSRLHRARATIRRHLIHAGLVPAKPIENRSRP